MMTKLKLIAGAALALACATGAQAQQATNFPTREIKAIVPYAAGGADDYIRPLADAIKTKHNMQMIVMNQRVPAASPAPTPFTARSRRPHATVQRHRRAHLARRVSRRPNTTNYGFEPVMHLITIPS